MNDTAIVAAFQYDHDAQRIVVEQKYSEAQTHLRQGLASLVEAGIRYRDIRNQLTHNRSGGFEGWLVMKGLAKGTIYRLIGLGETFAGQDIARLDLAASAAYLLAAPSVPDAVRATAIETARTQHVGVRDARQMIEDNAPRPADPARVERQLNLWSAVTYLDDTVRRSVIVRIANETASPRGPELVDAALAWRDMPTSTTRLDLRQAAGRLLAQMTREQVRAPDPAPAANTWQPPAARQEPTPAVDLTPAVLAWLDDQVANGDLADDDDGRRARLRALLNDRHGVGARAWASLNRRLGRQETDAALAGIRGALAGLLARERPPARPQPADLAAGLADALDRLVAYAARRPDPELDGLIADLQRLTAMAEELSA